MTRTPSSLNGSLQIEARVIADGDDTVARIYVDQSTSTTGTWTNLINAVGNVFYTSTSIDTSNGIYFRTRVETDGGDPVSNYNVTPSVKFS